MEDVEEDAELEWWELRRAQRAKQTTAGRSDPLPFAAGGSGAQRQQQQSCPLEGEAGASAVAAVLAAEATGHAWWPLGGLPAQGMGAAAVGGGGSGQHVDLGQPGGHGWGVAQILPPTAAGAAASLGSGTDGVASRMVPVSELGADPPPPFLEPAPPVLGKRKLVSLSPQCGNGLLCWRGEYLRGGSCYLLIPVHRLIGCLPGLDPYAGRGCSSVCQGTCGPLWRGVCCTEAVSR